MLKHFRVSVRVYTICSGGPETLHGCWDMGFRFFAEQHAHVHVVLCCLMAESSHQLWPLCSPVMDRYATNAHCRPVTGLI